jgi:hypothetical protein
MVENKGDRILADPPEAGKHRGSNNGKYTWVRAKK